MSLCPLELAFKNVDSNVQKAYTNAYNNKYIMDNKVLNTVDANVTSFNNKFMDSQNYKYLPERLTDIPEEIKIIIDKCPYCKTCKNVYIYDKETDLLLIAGMSLLFLTIFIGK